MKSLQSIPFVFGVTGHRDLREEDIPKLEERVGELFESYQKRYPHTEIIVISALAEGADMLVARVAKELGITLHVLLPYQEEEYLDSFDNRELNEKEFLELKEYAARFEINSCVHTYGAENCYQQLGEKIADACNILLALWDGVDNGKSGGTSAIVRYQREGVMQNRFDALDGNALFIITTPRKSNPDVNTDFDIHKEYLGKRIEEKDFEAMLHRIDDLNARIPDDPESKGRLETQMRFFEDQAGKNQTRFKNYSKAILVLTGIAITSLEVMHTMHIDNAIIGYGVGLLLAFAIYYFFMHNGSVQDDFVYSRGFAEAIRVQNAWNSAAITQSVAPYYLKDQHHKFTWIKTALKNMVYADKTVFTPAYQRGDTPEAWIESQIKYFAVDALPKRDASFKRWEIAEKFFYYLGFAALVLMFVIYGLEVMHIVEHGALWFNWHYLVLASGLLLLTATLIGEKYMKIEGYEEDIYHFNMMLNNFKDAKKALAHLKRDDDAYRKIIFDLGVKALDENSKWVVLHDKMRAKPSLD
jgi:hypothetical protein